MAKSQETFNKKEAEKRKLQKRKEKEQRREERKANAKEGKSLEEMFAYVDENGNLSSTPPDPTKKKEIKEENILLGARKEEPVDPSELIRTGKVTFFNQGKGFGFIRDLKSQDSVFVHINSLQSPIAENDTVTFEVERGPKGLNAVRVKRKV
ncbi:MAG: cold shock domain-containing protein [Cyclobacteriaceae bacterium]|nr:cold shock domain-containing protein [Cyclobacteriaceae bacterium]